MPDDPTPQTTAPAPPSSPATTREVHGHHYPLMWYTSGTPIRTGQTGCDMARFLGTHAGPHGTGYRRTATAVPLATGSYVHTGLELLGDWILEWQAANPGKRVSAIADEVVAWAASEAADRYAQVARSRGLERPQQDEGQTDDDVLILEQKTLVEALIWVYAIVRLPYMLSAYRLVGVEVEETPVFDCTCGLGDWVGRLEDHVTRGCLGIVMQDRPDYLWEDVQTGALVTEQFKTKATPKKSFEDAWEHSGQLWLEMEATSRRTGVSVSQAFVPVLYKGRRTRPWQASELVPKTQQSQLVYGYFDAGDPPVRQAGWRTAKDWTDEMGKGHKLPASFVRTPIFDERTPLTHPDARPGASRVEIWVRHHLQPADYPRHLNTLGPFPRPTTRMADAQQAITAEERKWREDIEYLRENQGYDHTSPLVIDLIPRSWNCTNYDGTRCPFFKLCHREPGWEDLPNHPDFEIRRPHHAPERAAFEACGVVFPADPDAGEDEGDDD